MAFSGFIRQLSEKTKLPQRETTRQLGVLDDVITRALQEGQEIVLPGIGRVVVAQYPTRTIVDPRDPSKHLVIPEQQFVHLRPSQSLKLKLRGVKPVERREELPEYARSIAVPYIDLLRITVSKDVLKLIPEHVARRYQVVPVEMKGNVLIVAMVDPEDREALEFIKKQTGYSVSPRISTQQDIAHVLDQYSGIQEEVSKIVKTELEEEIKIKPTEAKVEKPEVTATAPAAKIVQSLLKRAVRDHASDIHIEPEEKQVDVRFRIDGVLHRILALPKNIHPAVISRIKILCNLKIDETRLPQDGRFQAIMDRAEVDFRVSTYPTVNGEKVVARILDKSQGILTLEQLGLHGRSFKILEDNITKPHGMSLVTGPTGSGKTTTLYAIIDRIMNEGINIVTLEDPVEYRISTINQAQTNEGIGFTFANGLRSIVRQDPDVIMIGEIRDFETANIAIHAALTGHIVLSTLHTNDAAGAIPRLIDMKIEPFLIASSVNSIVAQRLARRICPDCTEIYQPTPAEMETVQDVLKTLPEPERKEIGQKYEFHKGKGCGRCKDTGYSGRVGVFEILSITEGIKKLISERVSSSMIAEAAEREGMLSMQQDGILKVLQGMTSIEEVWRVTKD